MVFYIILLILSIPSLRFSFKIISNKKSNNRKLFYYSEEEKKYFRENFPLPAIILLESKEEAISSMKKIIESKEDAYKSKEDAYKSKELLLKYQLSSINTKYLKLSCDLNIRRVIEELEGRPAYKNARKRILEEKKIKLKDEDKLTNPGRKEIWDMLLNDPTFRNEYECIFDLRDENKNLPIAGIITDLFNFSSKNVHTITLERVLIDLESLTSQQVLLLLFII